MRIGDKILVGLVLIIAISVASMYKASAGQSSERMISAGAVQRTEQNGLEPEGPNLVLEPDIAEIYVSNPYCYVSKPEQGMCKINWSWIYISAAPATYMKSLTIEIGGEKRAIYRGFFDTYIYVEAKMNGEGFTVPCGSPGANEDEDELFGITYAYKLTAVDNTDESSIALEELRCPGVTVISTLYLPALGK